MADNIVLLYNENNYTMKTINRAAAENRAAAARCFGLLFWLYFCMQISVCPAGRSLRCAPARIGPRTAPGRHGRRPSPCQAARKPPLRASATPCSFRHPPRRQPRLARLRREPFPRPSLRGRASARACLSPRPCQHYAPTPSHCPLPHRLGSLGRLGSLYDACVPCAYMRRGGSVSRMQGDSRQACGQQAAM